MSYDRLADLSLAVGEVGYSRAERETSSDFTRVTTTVELAGEGTTGWGEDVTYDAEDHDALAAHPPDLPVPFEGTFGEFSDALDGVDLFPEPPERETSRHYRRWAVESAALDLALHRAGTDLGSALGRDYDPVRFVASTRLGDPPTVGRIEAFLGAYPDLEFKLDPTDDWTPDLIERIAATGAARVLDLKGIYEGTDVDQPPDPDLYRRIVEGFPEAIIEDPAFTPETRPIFEGEEDRVAWDYPITGIGSIEELSFEPRWLNVKPSRFGTVRSLLETIEYATERGMGLYGGGQFELEVGRDQIQALASLFYPDGPNDVAPSGYNLPEVRADLPTSPLPAPDPSAGIVEEGTGGR